jgi:hypothetical protein
MSIISINHPKWTDDDIKNSFDEFNNLYLSRPIIDNIGGMRAPHAFASYFMLKKLQPKTIIESGVWKGQGTWLFEQACPNAKIICLDINFSNLVFKSKNAEYIEQDFSVVNFDKVDKNTSICFFDDHQDALKRLQQMKWKGFSKAIFEDNYPAKKGDCYSLKKIFANAGFDTEQTIKFSLKQYFKKILQVFARCTNASYVKPNMTHSFELKKNLSLYYEFPPLFREYKTRWGDKWDDYNYPTKKAIFESNVDHPLRNESLSYTWICLVELTS